MTEKKEGALRRPVLVACDDGYAETKVVLEDGTHLRFPSMVRADGVHGMPSDEVHSYETEGPGNQPFVYTATGDFDIEATNTRFDSYPTSPENRVMIHHALRRAGLGGQRLKIATSLPVQDYFAPLGPNLDLIERKSTNVMKAVKSTSGAPCAEVIGSQVFAEGVAAWVDFALDDEGDFRCVLRRAAAVIDIGGRTTDTVKILKNLTVEKANSGTCSVGVLDLYDEITAAIVMNREVQSVWRNIKAQQVTRSVASEVIATGRLKDRSLDIDMSADVKAAKSRVAEKIMRDVERRIETGFDLERLLFVGGGAAVLKDEIRAKYAMAEFVEAPEFANARGMLKLMKFS